MTADPLLGIAEELYGLLPSEFTGTRNEWAKQTKADGDPQLAARVLELRRPSVAAWVVNLLMRHQGEQMAQVLELGGSLRQAQSDLDADALRELTRQRRQLTAAVTHQARALAAELGQKVTDAVADQVQGTLHAAMVDEGAAAAVRSGMLVSALSATGVDSADVVAAVALPEAIGMTPRPRSARPSRPAGLGRRPGLSVVAGEEDRAEADAADADRQEEDGAEQERVERERVERERAARERAAREAARREVAEARAAAEEAQRKVRKARKRESRVQARTLQLADELEQVRRRAAELEHELDRLDDEAAAARERRERAEARSAQAQEAVDRARAALAELPEPTEGAD